MHDREPPQPAHEEPLPRSVPRSVDQARGRKASTTEPVVGSKIEKNFVLEEEAELDEFGFPRKTKVRLRRAESVTEKVEDWAERTRGQNGEDEVVAERPEKKNPQTAKEEFPPQQSNRKDGESGKPQDEDSESSRRPQTPKGTGIIKENEEVPQSPASSKKRHDSVVLSAGGISEWSHQALAPKQVQEERSEEEDQWQDMPAYGEYDVFDDDGNLVARGTREDLEKDIYEGLGGAGKGYTRVQIDDDARSATSMDENTSYLFKEQSTNLVDEHEEQRDPLAQMQATKDMLTEGQRIAYVGVVRLSMIVMVSTLESITTTKGSKKDVNMAIESMKLWSQKMMVRLYAHMEIDFSEQVMIEQLGEHGVQPSDLTPALMINSRVKNPMADSAPLSSRASMSSPRPDQDSKLSPARSRERIPSECPSPPEYQVHANSDLPEVQTPSDLPTTRDIDIDIRWTVLCDLFLVLIADSIYDSRSRVLLEQVGQAMGISWLDICRFEKRVTDALEMQEAAVRETWDEAEHMETRRKMALKRKYIMMGLATAGGTLVIGLSAGLLAPLIGAGLAAGFTTIGVAGTSGFLAGAGGTALITTGAALSGGTVAVRASHRRTGAVRTFEYRPLHNNKRVNLIITIAGWMNGKIDDVRLPFSTIDPIMGDIYSILWEPDMLQSMGDTIRILATEALTQGLQQVLASTILTALMASLTLPIVLTKLSYLLDNPWSVSLDRADAAGLILADSLIDRNLGVRPITLVGFSLGSRVIFSCLRELANKGAHGLVQNVYLFGSPIVAKKEQYLRAKTMVSGRFVNGYASNDWILGYLFRATSGGIQRVAGLAPVEEIAGLENVDCTELVNGHMAYRAAMPKLLRQVGWEIESDEFGEIEDPDPDNHDTRQRELIREIDEARNAAAKQPETRKWGLFKSGKLAEKKGWETYDDKMRVERAGEEGKSKNVLFDIDAIRAELESEHMEVRQLESTLPPMKLDLNSPPLSHASFHAPSKSRTEGMLERPLQAPHATLRETRSFDGTASNPHSKANGEVDQNASKSNPFMSRKYEYEYDDTNRSPTAMSQSTKSCENLHDSNPTYSLTRDPTPATLSPPIVSPPFASPPRPGRSYSSTSPAPGAPPSLLNAAPGFGAEHNAWVDEDEDFEKEKEMKLSFE